MPRHHGGYGEREPKKMLPEGIGKTALFFIARADLSGDPSPGVKAPGVLTGRGQSQKFF